MPSSLLKFINPILYYSDLTGISTESGTTYLTPAVGPKLQVPSTLTTVVRDGKTYGRTGIASGDTFILDIPNAAKADDKKISFEFTCCANQSFKSNYFYVGFANLWSIMFDIDFRIGSNPNKKLYANKKLLSSYTLYGNYTVVQDDSTNFRIAFNDYPNLTPTRIKCVLTNSNCFEFSFDDNKVAEFNTSVQFNGSSLRMLQQSTVYVDFTDIKIKRVRQVTI